MYFSVLVNALIHSVNWPLPGVFGAFDIFIALSRLLLLASLLKAPLIFSFIADILFFIPFNRLSEPLLLLFWDWNRVKSSDFELFKLLFFFPVVSFESLFFWLDSFVSSVLSTALLRLLKKVVFSRKIALRTNKPLQYAEHQITGLNKGNSNKTNLRLDSSKNNV